MNLLTFTLKKDLNHHFDQIRHLAMHHNRTILIKDGNHTVGFMQTDRRFQEPAPKPLTVRLGDLIGEELINPISLKRQMGASNFARMFLNLKVVNQ